MEDSVGKIEVPVICATRDFQGAVAETIVTLWNALWSMGRVPAYMQFQAHGYAFVRTGVFQGVRKIYNKDQVRGFMIDDDILLKSEAQVPLMEAISTADKFGWNFISPYRVRDGYTSISNAQGQLLRPDEVKALKQFDRVANGGLGFYYGDLPLSYQFHEDGVFGGEDLNFFWDNPQLDVRIFDLKLRHLKTMDLSLDSPLAYVKRPEVLPPKLERVPPEGKPRLIE